MELPQKAPSLQPINFARNEEPDVVSRLRNTLSAYQGRPSAELAEHVFEAFSALEDHLADLRKRAAASAGGLRAELVIERIELERERDEQMQRFSAAHARVRVETTRNAGDNSDGLRFANSNPDSGLGGE